MLHLLQVNYLRFLEDFERIEAGLGQVLGETHTPKGARAECVVQLEISQGDAREGQRGGRHRKRVHAQPATFRKRKERGGTQLAWWWWQWTNQTQRLRLELGKFVLVKAAPHAAAPAARGKFDARRFAGRGQ